MPRAPFMCIAVLVSTLCAPVPAVQPAAGPAATLSATLGGTLDSDMGEAGALSRTIDYSAIRLVPGRSIEYRRRIALEVRSTGATAMNPTPREIR